MEGITGDANRFTEGEGTIGISESLREREQERSPSGWRKRVVDRSV